MKGSHHVDQLRKACLWCWCGLQQVPRLVLWHQLQCLQPLAGAAHSDVASVSDSGGDLGRHRSGSEALQEVAPADASQPTRRVSDGSDQAPNSGLNSLLLNLQGTSRESVCAGAHVRLAQRHHCGLHQRQASQYVAEVQVCSKRSGRVRRSTAVQQAATVRHVSVTYAEHEGQALHPPC